MFEVVEFKREELYEQVWTEPIMKLAQKYSLSDVGLAKICKKLKIPMPGRGYWQKGETDRVPLPPLKIGDPSTYTLQRQKQDILPIDEVHAAQAEELIGKELLPENRIRVFERLVSPHPLVTLTKHGLEQERPDKYGRVCPWSEKKSFNISVAPKSINRAMRILDALIKGFDSRGFVISIEAEPRKTHVTVLGQKIEISLDEPSKRVTRKLTPAQEKERFANPWKYEKYEYASSGQLILAIKNHYWGSNIRHTWIDGRTQQLEDCLNDFMVGLIRTSGVLRSVELKWERERQKERELQLERIEQERKIREEQERFQALLQDVENWQKSKWIREYVEAVKQNAIQRNGVLEAGSELDKWFAWATQQADWLDPFSGDVSSP